MHRERSERQLTTQLRELCAQWDVPPRCVVVAVRTDALLAAATAAGCLTLEHGAAADHMARKARVRPSPLSVPPLRPLSAPRKKRRVPIPLAPMPCYGRRSAAVACVNGAWSPPRERLSARWGGEGMGREHS